MKLGSLFDGIGGFPYGATQYGITPLWASEIEAFPIKVTKIRFPGMEHHGDITKLNGAELPPVDIISGGSPCQDLSVAGKRAGLAGARSGLFMEQVRLIKEMRDTYGANQPRFMVWENVPGAFSSNQGEDFRAVLEEICRVVEPGVSIPLPTKGKWKSAGAILGDGYSIAWRVVDAQYWGVPQRRRRIYLVADFTGQSAPEILFKREGLPWNSSQSGEAREGFAGVADERTPKTMLIRCGKPGGGKGPLIQDNMSATLATANIQTLFDPEVIPIHDQATRFSGKHGEKSDGKGNGLGIGNPGDPMNTLTKGDKHAVAIDCRNTCANFELSGTIQSKPNGGQSLNYINPIAIDSNCQDSRFKLTGDIVPTIPAKAGTGGNNGPMLAQCITTGTGKRYDPETETLPTNGYTVRRLTPLECERLQGYPDGWTDIPGASDSARYKALGNSVAIPCVEYVMEGIAEVMR